ISLSGFWGLPFGRGRRSATHTNKVVGGMIDGCRMNWLLRYTSGNPIGGISAVNTCGTLLVDHQTRDQWWNNSKNCWKGNPSYLIRTVEDRYAWLRQMDNITVNLSAGKEFVLTE